MLQILIFSFCEESWNASLAKAMHMASHPPAAKGTLLRGGGGGGGWEWVNLLKKENLWWKSFYLLMQNEVTNNILDIYKIFHNILSAEVKANKNIKK